MTKQTLSKTELKKISGGAPSTGDLVTGTKGSAKVIIDYVVDKAKDLYDSIFN